MKRLLTIALLLLTAGIAEARQVSTDLLVVTLKSNNADGAGQGLNDVILGRWVDENVTAMLNEWGVDYIKFPASSLPTGKMNWLRTGRVIVGPDTISARAVLHERMATRSASFDYPAYRPDSLTKSVVVNGTPMLPSVPSLFVMEPFGSNQDAVAVIWRLVAACSVGVTNSNSPPTGGSGVSHECEACEYTPRVGRGGVYFPASTSYGGILNQSTTGGVLPLLSTFTNMVPKLVQEQGIMPANLMRGWAETDTDTTGMHHYLDVMGPFIAETPDTAYVWKRLNIPWDVLDADADTVDAAQMVFALGPVTLGFDDGSADTRIDYMYQSTFVGLCALDSLLGGDLLGAVKVRGHEVVPKKVGLTIDGGFTRVEQQFSQGVYLPDSAAVKATFDSLAAYGIPYLVGVNVDSVSAYAYEKAWYAGSPRFTPQVWSGVNGANGLAGYGASRYALRDLFGHQRSRQAYGPADGAANDTSFYSQLKFAFNRCDSLFPGRSSRFLLPPLDDMVPTNSAKADSMWIAARLAGASGIRIAGQDTLRRSLQSVNVQGRYFGLKALAHTGEHVTGGSRLVSYTGTPDVGGTYFVSDSGYTYHAFCDINDKALSAIVRGRWHSYYNGLGSSQFGGRGSAAKENTLYLYDANKYHNGWSMAGGGSLLKASMSSLGGSTQDLGLLQPTGEPLRPSWWIIRSVDGFRQIANAIAGRTLIMWAYPDGIEP